MLVSIRQLVLLALLLAAMATPAWAQIGLERALQVQQRNQARLFADQDVVATGISANDQGQAVLKVFTRRGVAAIPAALDGVSTVVVRSGEFVAWDDTKSRGKGGNKPGGGSTTDPATRFPRPVPIGVSLGSTGPNYCFAGTLGCRLKRVNLATGAEERFILSNNHVLAEENQGVIGFDFAIQPGTLDNNCVLDPADVIGTLVDFEPLKFNGQDNFVDAAIASTTTADTGFATPSSAYGAPTSSLATASPGMLVKKYGRTTGYTEGIVDSINVTVNVGYDAGTARFVNQIVIQGRVKRGNRYVTTSFSAGGDSGSLIVTQNGNQPTGLLFAGNSTYTIANPIGTVLDTFSDPANGLIMMVDDGK